ncbi:MAG: hypothetical protein LBF15_01650 [Candidatus Peribacteria bacterium]|nr:hypothetical protein [Candidatus Peribacteria bacterium]
MEELKDKIELLDESPSISNPFSLGEKGDKKLPSPLGGGIEGGGLFTKKFLLIQ